MTSILSSLTQSRPDAFTVRTVTNGVYSGATGADGGLAHATNWLILVAQTPGGVIVDGSAGNALDLHRAKKIMFVGFKFTNIRVLWGCEDINFWYCQQSNTASPPDDNTNGLIVFHDDVGGGRSKRITTCGGEFGTSVSGLIGNDPFGLNSCDNYRILGARIKATSPAIAPNFVHADGLQTTGAVNGLEIGWCNIEAVLQLAQEFGELLNLNVHDSWLHGSPTGNAIVLGHYLTTSAITGALSRLYIYDCATYRTNYWNPAYPGTNTPYYDSRPQYVNVSEFQVVFGPPPAGTTDPATVWQGLNPYDSYLDFLGGIPAPGTTFTPVLKKATDATGSSLSTLAASTASGPLFAVADPPDGIVSVAFKLDGIPVRTETTAPFSLGGDAGPGALSPFDTAGQLAGAHTLTAVVTFVDATTQTLSSVFTIPADTGGGSGGGVPTLQLVPVDYNDGQDRTTGVQDGSTTVGFHSGRHAGVGQLANTLASMAISSGVSVAVKTGGVWPPRPLVTPVVMWVGDSTPAAAVDGDIWVNTA